MWTSALTSPNSQLHRSLWNRAAFLRLAFDLGRQCTAAVRDEGWFSALRHQFRHHPRYHRLVHFFLHCQAQWQGVTPRPAPTFEQWKQACDEYCVPRRYPR